MRRLIATIYILSCAFISKAQIPSEFIEWQLGETYDMTEYEGRFIPSNLQFCQIFKLPKGGYYCGHASSMTAVGIEWENAYLTFDSVRNNPSQAYFSDIIFENIYKSKKEGKKAFDYVTIKMESTCGQCIHKTKKSKSWRKGNTSCIIAFYESDGIWKLVLKYADI
jgi:hypothetical protein